MSGPTETFYGKPVRWMVTIFGEPAEVWRGVILYANPRCGPTLFHRRFDARKVVSANEERDRKGDGLNNVYKVMPVRIEQARCE